MTNLIEELAGLINDVREPIIRYQLQQKMIELNKMNERREKILGLVQLAIAQFRVDMKYLQFDLEATRRERDEALGK